MPSASRARRKELLSKIDSLGVQVLTIPGMADIVQGKAKLEELQMLALKIYWAVMLLHLNPS